MVSGKTLYDLQAESGLAAEYCLVAYASGQYVLTPPSQSYMDRVVWVDDIAAGWRPHSDPDSSVRVLPDVRFGRPAVGGVSTEAVWELRESGEDDEEIAESLGLPIADVRWALSYETSLRAARWPVTPRPAHVRYYFDADVLGLAKHVACERPDCTYPGDPGVVLHKRVRPPCRIRPSTKDPIWIPQVTVKGWLIVTRDSKIQEHRAEIDAVRNNGARMVALNGRDTVGTWNQLEVLMRHWRSIEQVRDERGPYRRTYGIRGKESLRGTRHAARDHLGRRTGPPVGASGTPCRPCR